jgi:predicted Fe-S protein YdhL (DUF1289 family)
MEPASTPCVKLCVVDPRSNLCIGCGRTLDEIARWGALGEPERRAIMDELGARLVGARSRAARRGRARPSAKAEAAP